MSDRPIHPRPVAIAGRREHHLLRRVLRIDHAERFIARLVLTDDARRFIALVDSGHGTTRQAAPRDTALHVLWARDEANAGIDVEGHRTLPVAPGDTLTVAAGVAWAHGSGLIVCEVGGPLTSATSDRIVVPTHGLEAFDGYNRQTLCAITPRFTLERWKITQPLTIAGDAAIVSLVEPMALMWSGGTDLLGRGEARIVPPAIDRVTLLPNGLGYALVVRTHPDIAAPVESFSADEVAAITL